MFEPADALLCEPGPVRSPVDLTLSPEYRRGHGALYGGLNHGRIDMARLRKVLAGVPLPRWPDGRIVLAVDVSPWLRSDAPCLAERLLCHVYGRAKSASQFIPGWPYSFVAALEMGRSSWTAPLDVVRDITRLAYVLCDLPVELLGRIRSDRVLRRPAPPREEFLRVHPGGGRPPKHGGEFALADPASWPEPAVSTLTDTTHYGKAQALAWDRLHPRLTHRAAWLDHAPHRGHLDQAEGRAPARQPRRPTVWLWSSKTDATSADVNRCWQAFLRRFDLKHTYRFWKQTLGWTRPKLRATQAADRWTWLLIIVHTQLRLGRRLTEDLRHPWEKPIPHGQITPARVRRGFRNPVLTQPASVPKPSRPGPGRPPGIPNRRPAPRYDVGKTVRRGRTLAALQQSGG